MRHGCYPAPHTVYRGVHQLRPGHMLRIGPDGEPRDAAYWRLSDIVEAGQYAPFEGNEKQAVDALSDVLGLAVRERMVSDVPLGAFLSGGIDSSIVVALMQREASRPVKTYSIGFREAGYDESAHAKAVAMHLGTEHTEFTVTAADALAVIPRLPEIYDEPFADASQIPTFLVSQLARREVTVALTGDGGDEVFAGYNRYAQGLRFDTMARWVPPDVRQMAGDTLAMKPPASWDKLAGWLPGKIRPRHFGDKMHKISSVAGLDGDGFYHRLVSQWYETGELLPDAREPVTAASDPAVAERITDFVARMQYRDTLTYLPDDILTKVDRASMAASLEARAPLLDTRVLSLAWSLPMEMKLNWRGTKWILRQLLYRHVPQALVDRPKMGFAVPVGDWLRGPLKDWAEHLLSEDRLRGRRPHGACPRPAALEGAPRRPPQLAVRALARAHVRGLARAVVGRNRPPLRGRIAPREVDALTDGTMGPYV